MDPALPAVRWATGGLNEELNGLWGWSTEWRFLVQGFAIIACLAGCFETGIAAAQTGQPGTDRNTIGRGAS